VSSSDFDQNQVKHLSSAYVDRFEIFFLCLCQYLLLISGDKGEEGTRHDKLNKVRQLFWQTYRLFSEETSPSSTRSITQFLSKLATSVGMGGNSNT